jgi:hypothetical protein
LSGGNARRVLLGQARWTAGGQSAGRNRPETGDPQHVAVAAAIDCHGAVAVRVPAPAIDGAGPGGSIAIAVNLATVALATAVVHHAGIAAAVGAPGAPVIDVATAVTR